MNWERNDTALLQMWPAEFLEQFTIGFEWIGVWRLGKCVGQFCVGFCQQRE